MTVYLKKKMLWGAYSLIRIRKLPVANENKLSCYYIVKLPALRKYTTSSSKIYRRFCLFSFCLKEDVKL